MCRKCGKPIRQSQISRSSTCEFCGADLHTCTNCRFYAPGSHYDCHETVDELVKDKERGNFCDYFSPASFDDSGEKEKKGDSVAKARDAFATLFGGA